MEKLGSGLKKVLLAGIGAVAVTGEKSKELLDEMVKKGELTVEQGKALNEELKHNIKSTVKEKVNVKERIAIPDVQKEGLVLVIDDEKEIREYPVSELRFKPKRKTHRSCPHLPESGSILFQTERITHG